MMLIMFSFSCFNELKMMSSVGESALLEQLQEVGVKMKVYL